MDNITSEKFKKLFKKFLAAKSTVLMAHEYTYTNKSPVKVREVLSNLSEREFKIKTYKPRYRRSKALAMTNGVDIYLNELKLNRSVASLYGSIAHEYAHLCGFKHGNNCIAWYCGGKKKLRSVPYFIGIEFKRWLDKNPDMIHSTQNN